MNTKDLDLLNKIHNMNIMIVEDNNMYRRRIEQILNKYKIMNRSFFNSTKDALDSILCGSVYDLVIISWEIKPPEAAKEFCESVRKLDKSMPLVFITSSTACDYFVAFEAGASNIIKKPFDEDDFLEALWSALDIENFRRELRFKDLGSLKKQCFFRLSQLAAES